MYVNKTYFIFKYFTILSHFIASYFTIPVLPPVNLFLQLALVPVLDFITDTWCKKAKLSVLILART